MKLIFSSTPFAELAAIAHSKQRILLQRSATPLTTTLHVGKTTLTGLSIVRYLLRSTSLYPDSDPVLCSKCDSFDLNSIPTSDFMLGTAPSLADVMAWTKFRVSSIPSSHSDWFARYSSLLQSLGIQALLEESLKSETDLLHGFKVKIAIQFENPELILEALEVPKLAIHGDFCIPMPRIAKGNPAQLAKDYASRFVTNEYITGCNVNGIFIGFTISRKELLKCIVPYILLKGHDYGKNVSGANQSAIIEFSSPNVAKPFHAGHLRSTIIGNFMRNVLNANGYKTIAMNYLGDWGKQYGLLAIGYAMFGNEQELEKNPLSHLYSVYVQINKLAEQDKDYHNQARNYFKRMEDNDSEALALWKRFRDLSIKELEKTYAKLNIEFDEYSGESQVGEWMDKAEAILSKQSLLKESQGASIVDLEPYKLGTAIVKKSDGATLYLTRDIGEAMKRYQQHKFDKMYYVVSAAQDLHFKQLFKVIELMGLEFSDKLVHVNFGNVQGMSTRKGTAVFLDTILDETKEEMHRVMKGNEEKYKQIEDPDKIAGIIGTTAVIVQDMQGKRIKDYEFDWKRMFLFEGDTGPYLQYAHARLCSIERKCEPLSDYSLDPITEPIALEMVMALAQYPSIVKDLVRNMEPCTMVKYLFWLCHCVSSAFEQLRVVGEEKELSDARLALFKSAKTVLANGMRLLGLEPVERM